MVRGALMVGRQAYLAMKRDPELLIPNYRNNKDYYDAVLDIGDNIEEATDSTLSISERFRTSVRR